MRNLLNLYKPVGITPYQLIERLKEVKKEFTNCTLGYAGRLDPMAEGVMIVLIDEENKRRKEYERLPKTYEFEALYGIKTDTYDILGLMTKVSESISQKEIIEDLERLVPQMCEVRTQQYPPYSSPRVNGKPLFYWAREGKLDEITIPEKQIEIYSTEICSHNEVSKHDLQNYIFQRINIVHGEFRQAEILRGWNIFFQKNTQDIFYTSRFRLYCSSGTYVRSLVQELGEKLGVGALALNIKRIQVGEYTIEDSMKI